ncbi:hypothetical protein ACQPZK_20485 [Micromonospora sp. CA-249363]|uniref:hypothetical protein n=1 Tax=Micromonospora sp. CA-249363 TaxID=3239963 RepID=UPI003D8C077B
MTSIVAWAAVDARAVASLYIASDSRISTPDGAGWNQGRKVFACANRPHIFGYWGDVLFPALAIPVLVDRLDHGLPADDQGAAPLDFEQAVRRLWKDYPAHWRADLGIIRGYRIGRGMDCRFMLEILTYEARKDAWKTRAVPVPDHSSFLHVAGSGAKAVHETHELWLASTSAGTSRAAFSTLCESLRRGTDPRSGGAPQLAGLYRIGAGKLFGVVVGNQRYFTGSHLPGDEVPAAVEWRNELFERVDGAKRRRLPGAQHHAAR